MSDLDAIVWVAIAIANFNAAGLALTRKVSGSGAIKLQAILFVLNVLAGIFSTYQAIAF